MIKDQTSEKLSFFYQYTGDPGITPHSNTTSNYMINIHSNYSSVDSE